MDDEQINEERTALMQHMAHRGVSRKDGAYLFAVSIGEIVGTWCDNDDDKALVLGSLVRVARIQAGMPEAH